MPRGHGPADSAGGWSLREALAADTVSVIVCPVDYGANSALIASLGELDEP